jgi:hypothetical protein
VTEKVLNGCKEGSGENVNENCADTDVAAEPETQSITDGKADNSVTRSWEKRLLEESSQAFNAFSMYRSMGFRRTIKGVMALHDIPAERYGSWSRWSRKFKWTDRAAEYDEYVAKESEKIIIAEHAERRKHIMEMLTKFDNLVDRRLDSLKAEELTAGGSMDLLERSAKLDGYVSGADAKKDAENTKPGQLEINFVDGFDGV